MAAAAVRWRNVSRSVLGGGTNSTTPHKAYNIALYTRKLSATSSSDTPSDAERDNEEGGGTGIPSFSALKHSLEQSKISSFHHQSNQEEDIKTKNKVPHFQEVKASLRNPIPQRRQPQPISQTLFGQSTNFDDHVAFSDSKPSIASLDEIRRNLSEFRMKSAAPTTFQKSPPKIPSSSDHAPGDSFQALYESSLGSKSNINKQEQEGKERLSFQAIRESLQQLRSNKAKGSNESLGSFSLKAFGESLRLQPGAGGSVPPPPSLPSSVFGREMREKTGGDSQPAAAAKTEFMKMYSYEELGDKLRKLRPDVQHEERKGLGFSLCELNERLQKLREIEEKETESKIGGISFKDLRESLVQLRVTTESSNKKSSLQRLALLGQLGGQATPNFMLQPPKDHLIEQYFHPDNMSSAEKLKIELKKVREKFRMNEADCGSSRVQVAQLTTKINHLSQALHKKDKHSRKGLEAMVQRRKKLLKYLRRTDWDSYCFLLSKLGLRDNPDYKI